MRLQFEQHRRLWGRGSVALACLITLLAGANAAADSPIDRISEQLLSAGEAWQQPGFRIQLRVGTEDLIGLNTVPEGGGISLSAEPGVRLSRWFSLSATLHYTILSGELEGLRWSGTGDVSFHPAGGLFVAAGFGYAGIMADGSYDQGYVSCTGSGLATVGRLGWLIPLGDVFAMGPVVQADLQWTRCPDRSDSDVGYMETDFPPRWEPPRPPTTWRHRSLHFAWSFAWR